MKKIIEVTISKDGSEIKTNVSGFKGKNCITATEHLLKHIGQTTSMKKKPEYYQNSNDRIKTRM